MAPAAAPIDALPGYRRRFVVTPETSCVRTDLEDDYHCMSVTIRHADGRATAIEPIIRRAPWSTCPGAEKRLVETFAGIALADFAVRGEKALNCTHLHDLATLAAVHAEDRQPTVYDVLTSDPIDGASRAELRRDGLTVFAWTLDRFTIVAPPDVAGIDLKRIKPLLDRVDARDREALKILRWGVMVASGRAIPLEDQSDATRMPPNCFTFQPAVARQARRTGIIRDFSSGGGALLLDGRDHLPR